MYAATLPPTLEAAFHPPKSSPFERAISMLCGHTISAITEAPFFFMNGTHRVRGQA